MAGGSWEEYRKLVENMFEDIKELAKNQNTIKTEIALLKLKMFFIGALAGLGTSGLKDLIIFLVTKGG